MLRSSRSWCSKKRCVSRSHRVAQVLVELGVPGQVGRGAPDCFEMEPLREEVGSQGARAGIGQHPLDLLLQDRRIYELVAGGYLE